MTEDIINKSNHYNDGGIETIDFIEAKKLSFHSGNVVKYISRAGKKDGNSKLQDLEKAQYYLNRYIQLLKKRRIKNGYY